MEFLIFIALVVIIILLVRIKAQQKDSAARNHQSFLSLQQELKELKDRWGDGTPQDGSVKPTDKTVLQWRPGVFTGKPGKIAEASGPQQMPANEKEQVVSTAGSIVEVEQPVTSQIGYEPPASPKGWWQQWLRNNPDLEKFIGENLINKIGITVLVLGIAFFVKYAIDQNWIKETGRVSIGIACGAALVALAHYLRNTYHSFSSVLAGGGIAVFYFTIAFAFHEYHLFAQTTAFIIMVVITLFAVLLSVIYNRAELAIIAAIGGFVTPFLISTGSGNYIVLFTYLIILNMGMLALAWFKKWTLINVIAIFFTLIIYGGWLYQGTFIKDNFGDYKGGFFFATAFYILFLGMAMINNLRTGQPFKRLDFSLLLLVTSGYYTAGITNLQYWNEGAYQGIFTAALGATNAVLAYYLYKINRGDRKLLFLLIGLALTFISLAIPVQLHGYTITLFWSAEFVLLYWLFQRSSIRMFKYTSFIVVALMLISLLIDWSLANSRLGDHLPVIYVDISGLVTNIVGAVAFVLYAILLRRERSHQIYLAGITNNLACAAMIMAAGCIFYLTCVFGVNLYFINLQNIAVPNTWHQLITYLFTALLLWVISRYQVSINAAVRGLMVAGCAAFYFISVALVSDLRNGVLQGVYTTQQLWIHWVGALLLLYLVYQFIILYRQHKTNIFKARSSVVWLINMVLIGFFSVECMHLFVYLAVPPGSLSVSMQQYLKAGLTIVWALCSFTIMWVGMRYKYKTLRIVSLSLFLLALIKLFLFDIRNISEGGKIAAFIMLGILLLIISFMYQKLKKMIIEDTGDR